MSTIIFRTVDGIEQRIPSHVNPANPPKYMLRYVRETFTRASTTADLAAVRPHREYQLVDVGPDQVPVYEEKSDHFDSINGERRESRERLRLLNRANTQIEKFRKLAAAAEALREFLVDHPILNFDVPDEIWVPFTESLNRAQHPESPPESSGQPEQPPA